MGEGALSERQGRILEYLRSFILKNGYPPSIRQIMEATGIPSTSMVNYNLESLEKKGYITRERSVSRAIRLTEKAGRPHYTVSIPFYGAIAAGTPIPVPDESNFSGEVVEVAQEWVPAATNLFALRVRGNSMIDAYVEDGDLVILRSQEHAETGEMVAAWLEEEKTATLKKYYPEPERNRVRLQPQNSQLQPIYVRPENLRIRGKVVAVIRRYA